MHGLQFLQNTFYFLIHYYCTEITNQANIGIHPPLVACFHLPSVFDIHLFPDIAINLIPYPMTVHSQQNVEKISSTWTSCTINRAAGEKQIPFLHISTQQCSLHFIYICLIFMLMFVFLKRCDDQCSLHLTTPFRHKDSKLGFTVIANGLFV